MRAWHGDNAFAAYVGLAKQLKAGLVHQTHLVTLVPVKPVNAEGFVDASFDAPPARPVIPKQAGFFTRTEIRLDPCGSNQTSDAPATPALGDKHVVQAKPSESRNEGNVTVRPIADELLLIEVVGSGDNARWEVLFFEKGFNAKTNVVNEPVRFDVGERPTS
jgi:hypothetical protein